MTLDAAIIARYKSRGILVDSSLLIAYLVGNFDRRQLTNCRATKSTFTESEFELLAAIIQQFDVLVTTPHVLTEVSNLAGRLPPPTPREIPKVFCADYQGAGRSEHCSG